MQRLQSCSAPCCIASSSCRLRRCVWCEPIASRRVGTKMLLSNDTGVGVSPTGPTGLRDVRLDFFRGLALLCIFIDHTPGNILGFVTARAYGLSDAAEMFVLIAGYTAVLAYSRIFEREGM